MTETSTQQRPWAAVARYPKDNDPVAYCAHFAAMVVAHDKAFAAAAFEDDAAMRAANDRHLRPMVAAFAAACGADPAGEWTVGRIRDACEDGSTIVEAAHEWLTAAGINPDEIAPAS